MEQVDRIVSGRHTVVIQRRGREYRWRCSCDRRKGCAWKSSEANVRWGGERHLAIAWRTGAS